MKSLASRAAAWVFGLLYENRAQDLIEYALMASTVAVAAGAFMPPVADHVSVVFSKLTSLMGRTPS
jgi:Flp pilus assembly pilin Flp